MEILTTEAKTKLVSYRDEFLKVHPNDELDGDDNPKYTDAEWVDVVVKRWLVLQLRIGDQKIKREAIALKSFDLD